MEYLIADKLYKFHGFNLNASIFIMYCFSLK